MTVNQQINGGQWNLLGTFTMAPGQNHQIVVSDNADGIVIADAVQVTRVGAPPSTATWLPVLPRADTYQVYERTPGYGTWTSTAPFTVFHQGGSNTTLESEVTGGGTWKLLGTYDLYPGQNHRVELTDVVSTGSYVVADAVKFVPVASAKSATWTIPGSLIATTGSYRLYAKWPASASHTPEAAYTVNYQGGTATVTANQRVNGGQWNLLGTFPFNAGGSGYKVTLADSALGKVAADAIYIVGTAPAAATFTWTPTFPSAGAYQVYARWPASSANTGAAQYTVTRDGGTSTVTLNQKQNGGAWVLLGSYNFTPAAGHKVTLAASSDGTTIADALLFVGSGAQPANLLYVHADHLGSPQKMTDASQAIVWDSVLNPFGEEVAITGLAAMPMRFPGQYADDETGFSYNFLRDYEPRLGRYLQSDPIDLGGGINPYLYSLARPTTLFDRLGLVPDCETVHVDSFVRESTEYVHQIVDTLELPTPKYVGVGLGGDLPDPRHPWPPRISPSVRVEIWMVRYTEWFEATYRVSQWFEEVWVHCKEVAKDGCTYTSSRQEFRPLGEAVKQLLSSRTYVTETPLYLIGVMDLPIIP